MSEEKQVKKQLLKNMILNLVTFSIIFTILGIIIYGQFKSSLYISADSELEKTNTRREFRINNERKLDIRERRDVAPPDEQENSPRLIFITRNSNGELESITITGDFYYKDTYTLNLVYDNITTTNIKVYNYVMGKSVYPGAKNYLEILHNKIENYEFISDSGTHFEEKLFGKDSKMNYFNSEFFLNVENLNQPLKDFKEKLKDFGTKINESNEFKELRDKTSVSFKSFNNSFYFGNCLLDPKKPLFMN